MKAAIAVGIGTLLLACSKGGDFPPRFNGETQVHADGDQSKNPDPNAIPGGEPKWKSDYGILDGEGYPIDPGFAMNSNRIDRNQRAELRQSPPEGYHVRTLPSPRFINRKDEKIAWKFVSLEPSGNLSALMRTHDKSARIPDGLYPDDQVRFSPSRKRILVGSGSRDRWQAFAMGEAGWEMKGGLRVRSVTFDEKWRWFIDWKCFMDESKIVGVSITDDEIESYPEQHRLYTYDIDSMVLTRIQLPAAIQPKGFEFFQIEAVAPGAVLLRLGYDKGRTADLFTVYLDEKKTPDVITP